jgi:transcriptional regulator with XRE-family HTH domain
MPKTIFTGAHVALVETLVEARRRAGLTQTELAQRVGKDQSFISLIERSQRRVDTLEFYALARALNVDPVALFKEVARKLPSIIPI